MSALARFAATSSARNVESTGATSTPFLSSVVLLLAEDRTLPDKNRDHSQSGEWDDHWECHLKPDLLLIYRKPDPQTLQLVRLGSDSELFG